MEQRHHYDEIDIAKGIGILLVVIGHSTNNDSVLHTFIYLFHMPLFFIMSGLFIVPSKEKHKIFLKETKLLSYYIFYSLIFLLYSGLFKMIIFHEISFALFKYSVFITCIFYGISVLWFIGTLFWAKILVGFIITTIKKNYFIFAFLLFAISGFILFMIPDIDDFGKAQIIRATITGFARIICASSFVLVGYIMKSYLFEKKYDFRTVAILSTIIMIVLVCAAFYFNSMGIKFDLHMMYLGRYTAMFWLGIIGFVPVFFISKYIIPRVEVLKKLFVFWGKNSLIIMILHEYFGIKHIFRRWVIAMNIGNEILISTILLIIFVSLFAKAYYNLDNKIINKLNQFITIVFSNTYKRIKG